MFTKFTDALAQIAGLIKGLRELERTGKRAPGTANKLQAQLGEFMALAEDLSAQEAAARLQAITDEAQKATKASTRITSIMTPTQAHGLRAALGLRPDPDADEQFAKARSRAQATGWRVPLQMFGTALNAGGAGQRRTPVCLPGTVVRSSWERAASGFPARFRLPLLR